MNEIPLWQVKAHILWIKALKTPPNTKVVILKARQLGHTFSLMRDFYARYLPRSVVREARMEQARINGIEPAWLANYRSWIF